MFGEKVTARFDSSLFAFVVHPLFVDLMIAFVGLHSVE